MVVVMAHYGTDPNPNPNPETATETRAAESEIDLPAPPSEVWERLTTDDGLAHWMGEGSQIEPVVGAPISVPDVVTGQPKSGRVKHLEQGRQLDFVWWPEANPDDFSEVSITLEPLHAGTRVRVVERLPRCSASVGVSAGSAWAWRGAMAMVNLTTVLA